VQIPGYLEHQDALKALGVEEVVVFCVNDGAVMQAWGKDQGIEGSMITFMGDPMFDLTSRLDMEITDSGPLKKGLFHRSKRFALYVVDGVVQYSAVSEKPDDPAGDDFPEDTCAPAMIEAIKSLPSHVDL
jgi:peroxiredoxin